MIVVVRQGCKHGSRVVKRREFGYVQAFVARVPLVSVLSRRTGGFAMRFPAIKSGRSRSPPTMTASRLQETLHPMLSIHVKVGFKVCT